MPELLLPFTTQPLPFFNRALLLPINFVAAALILMVLNHKGLKEKKGKLFVMMGLFILTWVDFAYLARRTGEASITFSESLLRIAWIATPPVFFSSYWISINLIGREDSYKKLTSILFIITLVLSCLAAFTDVIIAGVSFRGQDLDIIYGIGFLPFLGVILLLMACTIFPMIKSKLNGATIAFLIGLIIFYIANMIFNITLPFFFNITHLYYFGDYSTIFLLGFTTYAIIRHELFEIKVFATEILTIVIWSILLTQLTAAQSIGEMAIDGTVFTVMILFGMFLIRSVRREIEQRQQLQLLTEKLKQLDQQKDEFLNVASHELRAPMTAIKGYLSMIQNGDAGEIPTEAKEFIDEATTETERMIRLVNNMLNVARIEEGRMVFEPGEVRLDVVVERVFNEFKFEAEGKHLDYQYKPEEKLSDKVIVDMDRIHEVVANLINNAIKYTDEGTITVRLLNPNPKTIRFEVEDTGPGMTPDEVSKLFNKFYRTESYVGKKMGTGLGLYISKLLVQKFGGQIGVHSEKGKGSTFWFELPVKVVS